MKTRAAGFATHLLLVTVDAALLGRRIKDRQSAPRQAVIRAAGNVDLGAQPVGKAPSYQTRPCTVCVHLDDTRATVLTGVKTQQRAGSQSPCHQARRRRTRRADSCRVRASHASEGWRLRRCHRSALTGARVELGRTRRRRRAGLTATLLSSNIQTRVA